MPTDIVQIFVYNYILEHFQIYRCEGGTCTDENVALQIHDLQNYFKILVRCVLIDRTILFSMVCLCVHIFASQRNATFSDKNILI